MRKKKLYIVEMPQVSNEFAHSLGKRFPALEVKPGVTQDELLYNAGQRSVVEFVMKTATGTIISGDVNDIRETPENKSLLSKLLGIIK